jgi:demethylmenaquinone methyltransferase/2-methoxy-6-polyprenyl-1,4-benzoquinol methylase
MTESVDANLAEQVEYYRARAAEYDEWWLRRGRYDRGLELNAHWHREAAELERALADFKPHGRILELAGGTGIWSEKLLRYTEQLTIVDASSEVLAMNAARLRSARVEYVQTDLLNWLPSDRFDVVFFSFWLSHVPESKFDSFWERVRASLAVRGRVFFIDSRREPTSTASDHSLPDTDSMNVRRLNDGRTFRIYKIFYDAAELQERLRALGWRATVQTTSRYFLFGWCVTADA